MNTTWLVARSTIDPNNVPIAGVDADGSGTLDAPMSDGLTSMVFYDSNLTDGVGLDSTAGMAIPDVGTLLTINVSISNLIGQLTTATGFSFGTGSAGSAVLSVNAEQEFSVSIADGMGRTVMVAMAEPVAQSANLQAVTWSFSIYDNTFNIGTGTPKFVAETRSMDALGNIVRSRTDGAGRTLQTVDALGNISTVSFDASSNVVAVRDPNQVGYNAVYDALGRMTSRTDTFGIATSATYDLGGNVTISVDGKGKSTTSQFDAAGRKISVTDRLAGQTLYSMDLASNLTSIVDAEGKVTTYTYNDRGLRESETYPDHSSGSVPGDPDCGQRFFQYDAAGRLLHIQDQANHWQTMIYDLASRLTERQYRIGAPTGTPIDSDTFALDRVGRMTSAVSGRYSNTVSMDYDSIGRMNSESLAIGGQTYVTGYERDVRNQINKIVYPSTREAEYTYTNREELDLIEWDQSQIENRGYDVGGRMTSVDRPHADETRVYDLANRLTSIANTASVGTLSYTWDANSNKLTETWTGVMSPWSFTTKKPAAPTFKEGYDDEDRFRRFIRSGQSQDIYLERSLIGNNTDLATNGTSSLRTFNAVHEMVSVGGNSQQFDNRGNVTNTHAGVGLSFDFDNRLKQATPVAGKVVDYQYDALGKRVGKKVTENSVVVEDTIYVHAGPNCVAEYNRGAAPSSPVQEYVYGDEIDSLAMIVRNNGTEKLAVTRNQQWSIVALVNNANGSVVERYSYDQFGKRRILNASGFEISNTQFSNPYGYTCRAHDAESGLMYFRARNYDVTTGEFTSRDPVGYVEGWSLYRAYMGISAVDPNGEKLVIPVQRQNETLLEMLDKICPEAKLAVREDGTVYATELGFCTQETGHDVYGGHLTIGPTYACTGKVVSCGCVCDAINSDCEIRLYDGLTKPLDNLFGTLLGGEALTRSRRATARIDGAFTDRHKNCNADVFVGTKDDGVHGIGDSDPPAKGKVRSPRWLILAHELCGHAVPNMGHPMIDTDDDGVPDTFGPTAYTPDDPVIVIENMIRCERSTKEDCFGKRTTTPRKSS